MTKHLAEWAIASHSYGKLDAFISGEFSSTIGVCSSVTSAVFLIPPLFLPVYGRHLSLCLCSQSFQFHC